MFYLFMKEISHTNVNCAIEALQAKVILKKHVTSGYEGKKPFKCELCESSFAAKSNLKIRISSVHEKIKFFKCEMCDASFALKHHLQGHIISIAIQL